MLCVRFSGWVFDESARALRDGSEIVHVSPKAFELLGLLIGRHPDAVSKAEILETLWPHTFVAGSNLTKLIREVRAALVDDAQAPRYVRTVHRYGYAFVAPLEAAERTSRRPRARLVWNGRVLPLVDGDNSIGRTEESLLQIDAPTISRRHATIRLDPDGATLIDLGSKNGTFLRGVRITRPTRLRFGDVLYLGSEAMTFERRRGSRTTSTGTPP